MTNNKQQTALDWYIEQHNILAKISDSLSHGEIVKRISDIEKQAKEMEKQEMKHWFRGGMHLVEESLWKPSDKFEEIYNEIYGGNK
jgi:hypothetical protein